MRWGEKWGSVCIWRWNNFWPQILWGASSNYNLRIWRKLAKVPCTSHSGNLHCLTKFLSLGRKISHSLPNTHSKAIGPHLHPPILKTSLSLQLPSLVPRPSPFFPSVCIHNNTRERKNGRLLLWMQTGDQNGGGLGPRVTTSLPTLHPESSKDLLTN